MFKKLGCGIAFGMVLPLVFPFASAKLYTIFANSQMSAYLINPLIKLLGIDTTRIQNYNIQNYKTWQQFFSRKEIRREFDKSPYAICCPADSLLYACSQVTSPLVQFGIKGRTYNVEKLYDDKFQNMQPKRGYKLVQMAFYLSPRNYHYFFSPHNIEVTDIKKLGGYRPPRKKSYNSVRPSITKFNPQIFNQNYRVVVKGSTVWGNIYIAFVGAYLVDGIQLERQDILHKGHEAGHFNIGSSVVMLMEVPISTQCKKLGNYFHNETIMQVQ